MKKLNLVLFAMMALSLIACKKEASVVPDNQPVRMIFNATTEETTKTTLGNLSEGKYPILWAADDQIKVIATDDSGATVGAGVFDIASGAGTKNAQFTGTLTPATGHYASEFANYYAVYPVSQSVTIAGTGDAATVSFTEFASHSVLAVENGFDPSKGLMFAAENAGSFSFKHGMVYFKLTIGESDVASVELSCKTSDTRIYGNPTFKFSDGTIDDAIGDASKNNNYVTLAPTSGTLTQNGVYYIPVIAKNRKFGDITLTYTNSSSNTVGKKTSKLNNVYPSNGTVYDLGCPPITFSPTINVTAPGKLEASVTEGSFTYTVSNPDGVSSVSAAIKSGTWISNVAASAGTVTFDCTANTGEERTAVITLSYTGAANVDVTVTQKAPSSSLHTHVFYYNSSGTAVNKTDNADGSYFTATGATNLGGDYHISDWTIGDYSSSKGVKLNSDGRVTFTTSATLNSTVQFWFIRRKTGDSSAEIQIVPEGGSATVFDSPWDAYTDSGVLALAKGTSYTISRSDKEQALLLVIVEETE